MKCSKKCAGRRAFTLIELLAVIAVIGILITLVSPAIRKAQFQAKLTREATRARGIVEAIMAKEAGSRYSTGWPQSDDPDLPGSSTEFLTELVEDGYLDVDFSYFAGPGQIPAKNADEFSEANNMWKVVLDVDDATRGNTPVVFSRNYDPDSGFDESEPLGLEGFVYATKNGEAVALLKDEMADADVMDAVFGTNSPSVLAP